MKKHDYRHPDRPPEIPSCYEPPPPSDDDYFAHDPFSEWSRPDADITKNHIAAPVAGEKHGDTAGNETSPVIPGSLRDILKDVFHFDSFRPYQERVCESVVAGRDLLLVMPTGSGKSLCYQLPGIARRGTTLVVSPLIALMEDQTLGLKQKGFRAERIHSGRSRSLSRHVCKEYLDGRLDFLFIAPERLAVPGFPEMLARRRPVLIAIDEAHCISQWGHDFRPDYRLLGDRLPILRPAPVIAMTATATPRVQNDIVQQLGIVGAEMCIHGFRRTNIAIELIEMLPSKRSQKVIEILEKKESLPAIIYTPTRQKTEALATELKDTLSVAPYHAGLSSDVRDRVQAAFLSGELDAIVATIAFGMGIDKPDVRTVIHTALPGSLEGYYQEIGRAGRDGKPSRAILLHSYGDRRVHQFFHERGYPHHDILNNIYKRLSGNKKPAEKLRKELHMDEEEFETALEKLWIHGGALVDPDETVRRGHNKWPITYRNQSDHRLAQIDDVARFSKSSSCRMLYLIRHFGDREDSGGQCGICDFCAPENSTTTSFRKPDKREEGIIYNVISTLKRVEALSTGRLYSDVCPDTAFSRSDFENILSSLARADLIALSEHAFEKQGQTIHYKKAGLTDAGRSIDTEEVDSVPIISQTLFQRKGGRRDTEEKKPKSVKVVKRHDPGKADPMALYDKLRQWRIETARRKGLPAFRIFSNKVLDGLVSEQPKSNDELRQMPGVGPYFARNYGKEIIKIIKTYVK
ncbi:DNA topoisomerase (fragment) [uncultured Desulfobacterium sp.]|uniref:ATP-dependent DNA helicase RecQ n=1 Tax=uncultured Desulfobacterium sp. TaxID=201089 RepID=A0A445MU99_9BACT